MGDLRAEQEDQGSTTHFDVVDVRKMLDDLNSNIPILMCLRGEMPREPYQLKEERTTIGRVPQCNLQLAAPNVSRLHAVVKYLNWNAREEEPVCHLVDNNSTNGVFVNGTRIVVDRALRHGDLIGIGDFVFGFFVRKETELVMDERAREVLTRFGALGDRGRIATELAVRLRILIPEDTFTPATIRGIAKDLSLTGLRFSTTEISGDLFRRLLTGNRYIRVELSLEALQKTFDLPGRMAWVHYDNKITPPVCVMGVEFKDITPEQREDLRMELQLISQRLITGSKEPLPQN